MGVRIFFYFKYFKMKIFFFTFKFCFKLLTGMPLVIAGGFTDRFPKKISVG